LAVWECKGQTMVYYIHTTHDPNDTAVTMYLAVWECKGQTMVYYIHTTHDPNYIAVIM
jgi:uncharacterized membrane protein